jgi:hypothetical protein
MHFQRYLGIAAGINRSMGDKYRIRKADDQEYGPVTAEELRQWIAAGHIFARTLIEVEGTADWKELGEFSEFAEALTAARHVAPASGPPPSPAQPLVETQINQSLARVSLLLGIISALGCACAVGGLTAVPAIITGHIARRRARQFPAQYGGAKKAQAGLALGYTTLVVVFLALGVGLPAFNKARLMASWPACVDCLEKIGAANLQYAARHDGRLPPNFLSLSNDLAHPINLVCPSLRDYPDWPADVNWSRIDTRWFTYEFLTPGAPLSAVSNRVVIRCARHGHALFGNGRVQRSEKNRPEWSRTNGP